METLKPFVRGTRRTEDRLVVASGTGFQRGEPRPREPMAAPIKPPTAAPPRVPSNRNVSGQLLPSSLLMPHNLTPPITAPRSPPVMAPMMAPFRVFRGPGVCNKSLVMEFRGMGNGSVTPAVSSTSAPGRTRSTRPLNSAWGCDVVQILTTSPGATTRADPSPLWLTAGNASGKNAEATHSRLIRAFIVHACGLTWPS
jgi:hypothetical protein